MAHGQRAVGLVLGLWLAGLVPAADRPALVEQQERQRQIQADADRLVRRLNTILRVLEYNRLDRVAEKAMLDEVTGLLAGLSREQMTQVIAGLEKARKESGDAQVRDLKVVQDRHEHIVLGLKALLARFDAVRTLEQAADRLDRAAREQQSQYVQTGQVLFEVEIGQFARGVRQSPQLRISKQAGEQGFLHRDAEILLKQMAGIVPFLPEEEQQRVQRAQSFAAGQKLLATLKTAQQLLQPKSTIDNQLAPARKAVDLQWQTSGDLAELARQLRPTPDRLTALRQVRQAVDTALRDQDTLLADVRQPFVPAAWHRRNARFRRGQQEPDPFEDPDHQWARELSARQGNLAFSVRDARQMLQPHLPPLAARLEPLDQLGRDAEKALRYRTNEEALHSQERIVKTLREVLAELDRQVGELEQRASDPLHRVKDQLATVAQLIREQEDLRQKAQESTRSRQSQRMQSLAPRQQELAGRAQELAQQREREREPSAPALQKAAQKMERAAQALQEHQGIPSQQRQDEAIEALREARKGLAEQVARNEARRKEIARLEDAERRLAELARQEDRVAETARQLEREGETEPEKSTAAGKLAEVQGKLTAPTRELARQVEQTVPEAARKAESGAEAMETARARLEQSQAPGAAQKAEAAARKLHEAREELARALEQKKGEEAAEEQAAQPRQFDTSSAAQQLAKALAQTQAAAEQSEKAAEQVRRPGQKEKASEDLARRQKQIAEQASQARMDEARKPAEDAARALRKGDARKALAQQKRALAELERAARMEAAKDLAQEKEENEKKEPPSKKGDPDRKPGEKQEPEEKGEPKTGKPPSGDMPPTGTKTGEQKPPAPKEAGTNASQPQIGEKTEQQSKPGEKQEPGKQGRQGKKSQPPRDDRPPAAKKASELVEAQKEVMQATEEMAREQAAKQPASADDEARPSLAELQQQVAEQAEKVQTPAAEPPASRAARALKKGDLTGALEQQKQALAQLEASAGNELVRSPPETTDRVGVPLPKEARTAGELGLAQKALMEATEALAKSQAASQAAMTALGQAQAQAPQAVQGQLQQASQQLAQACQQCEQAAPQPAHDAQESARENVEQALQALNNALARAEDQEPASRSPSVASKEGQQPGSPDSPGPGRKPGTEPEENPGQELAGQLAPSSEQNERPGTGRRMPSAADKLVAPRLRNIPGEGLFIHLPPRQRELIRQALDDKLPPEYAGLIQQYYINIARGKAPPPSPPAAPRP